MTKDGEAGLFGGESFTRRGRGVILVLSRDDFAGRGPFFDPFFCGFPQSFVHEEVGRVLLHRRYPAEGGE